MLVFLIFHDKDANSHKKAQHQYNGSNTGDHYDVCIHNSFSCSY